MGDARDLALQVETRLTERFEGFRGHPYLCPARIPTIGFGSTHYEDGTAVTLKDPPISLDRARALANRDRLAFLAAVLLRSPSLALTPQAWGAIADFAYNLGTGRYAASTLRRRIAQGDWPEARRELAKWVFGGGVKLPGLAARRAAEAAYLPSPAAA